MFTIETPVIARLAHLEDAHCSNMLFFFFFFTGKTSLIKVLTGDKDMVPENRLFATLDVTSHAGYLPNHMMVLYMDTVGFICDLPYRLKDAFSSTLEDLKIAVRHIH